MALDLLGCEISGRIAIEKNKVARKVYRTQWPETLCYNSLEGVDDEIVGGWFRSFGRCRKVIHSICFACADAEPVRAEELDTLETGLLYEALRPKLFLGAEGYLHSVLSFFPFRNELPLVKSKRRPC